MTHLKTQKHAESYSEKKEKTGGKVTEPIVAEHCKSLVPLLKLIPGRESMNDDIQEWTNQDEEQITDDKMTTWQTMATST
jgi:hypothetical protein